MTAVYTAVIPAEAGIQNKLGRAVGATAARSAIDYVSAGRS